MIFANSYVPIAKVVTLLEYQAYTKLALKTMADIVAKVQAELNSTLIHCAVHHRLGTVPVGEPSIGTSFIPSC